MKLNGAIKKWLSKHGYCAPTLGEKEFKAAFLKASKNGSLTIDKIKEIISSNGAGDGDSDGPDAIDEQIKKLFGDELTPEQVFGGDNKSGQPRVKDASERYSEKRWSGKHAKTGLTVKGFNGREVETPSECDYAKAGAFHKFLASKSGISIAIEDHERHLINEMFAKDTWVGVVNNQWSDSIVGTQAKALLSDSTSGGVDINPIWYDQAVTTYPLLNGEILPYIDLMEQSRGASINSAAISNPAVNWGQAEGSAIPIFDTAGMIQPKDTNTTNVTFAIEIGRDMLSDSIADLGRYVIENIGQVAASELDRVIAVGNGTSEPQGILSTSGLVNVPSAMGANGSLVVTDCDSLYFGIGKQYRKAAFRPCYIGTDSAYMAMRTIPVGPNDARRVFGNNVNDYTINGAPFRVNNSIDDTKITFGCLAKYRLYRRQGSEIRYVTEGQTLALKNTVLIIMRGRFAGRVLDNGAFALMTNAGVY